MGSTATVRRASRSRAPAVPARAIHDEVGLSPDDLRGIYRAMLVSRRLSEQCMRLTARGAFDVAIPADGHEAAQVASVWALRPTDSAYLYYRSVPAAIARGVTAREIMLDSYGRAEGPSHGGRNIPGHWSKRELRLFSISGSVGTQIPNAVGTALADRIRGTDAVTIVYFGDGGVSKSDFHEGLNFAAVHHVPVILFCENNGVAISVTEQLQSPVRSVAERASAYGAQGESVDGADVFAVYRATTAAVERARRGDGPSLIEARVARISQHTNQVADLRPPDQIAAARARDPIPRFALYLQEQGLLDAATSARLWEEVEREVEDACSYAEAAPSLPVEAVMDTLYADVKVPNPLLAFRTAA